MKIKICVKVGRQALGIAQWSSKHRLFWNSRFPFELRNDSEFLMYFHGELIERMKLWSGVDEEPRLDGGLPHQIALVKHVFVRQHFQTSLQVFPN